MPKNARYSNALHINVPVPEGSSSGDPVLVEKIAGVQHGDRQPDGTATVWLDRSYDIPVDGAVAKFGASVYMKADKSGLTATATGNTAWGVALAVKGAALAPLHVAPLGFLA